MLDASKLTQQPQTKICLNKEEYSFKHLHAFGSLSPLVSQAFKNKTRNLPEFQKQNTLHHLLDTYVRCMNICFDVKYFSEIM